VTEGLAIDGAVRGGLIDTLETKEIRLGFTWATDVWHVEEK
jgi:hypothetical protein